MAGDDILPVLDVTKDFGDRYIEVTAWRVPASDRYPEGVKYSMQYGSIDGGTVLRYDNFPDHPGAARHHRHAADGSVEDIEFQGLRAHYERFKSEVERYGERWD